MNKSLSTIIKENDHPLNFLRGSRTNCKRLFITAFLQVFLVTANTYFVSRIAWLGIAACSFGISYIWTLNVKRISASSPIERIAYSTGAMAGGLLGVFVSKFIIVWSTH